MNRLDPNTGVMSDLAFDQAHPQLARRLQLRDRRETIIPGAHATDTATVLRAAADEATAIREQRDAATGIPGYGRLPAR
jgi:hypothetical protein